MTILAILYDIANLKKQYPTQIMNHELVSLFKLSENEERIYLALLSVHRASTSVLSSKTKLERGAVTYACEHLLKKKMIYEERVKNTRFFTAASPESLHGLMKEQEDQQKNRQEHFFRIFDELKRIQNPHACFPKIRFYEGIEGMMAMFDHLLAVNRTVYGFVHVPKDLHPDFVQYREEVYFPRKKEQGFCSYAIMADTAEMRENQKDDVANLRCSLLAPESVFPINSWWHIYGDYVALYSYTEKQQLGIIIENEAIREMQFSVFRMAWGFARSLEMNEGKEKVDLPIV